MADLQHVDPDLANSIRKLQKVAIQKQKLEQDTSQTQSSLKVALDMLTLDGCPIEDLNLDFTLPGHANIDLKKSGRDITVNIHNLEEYLKVRCNFL